MSDRELTNEIASIGHDPMVPVYGGALLSPDDLTLLAHGGVLGYRTYDQIEQDGHAYAVLQKRKMAVIARNYEIVPASDDARDVEAADLAREQLADLGASVVIQPGDSDTSVQVTSFDLMCLELLDATLKGFAVGEAMWEVRNGKYWLTEVRPRAQHRFRFQVSGALRLLTPENQIDGEAVPNRKFIVHRFGSKTGNPYGLGLGSRLYWPVFFKRQDVSFWLRFADKFGAPTVVGKYGSGATDADKRKLLQATQAVQSEAGVVIPDTMLLELMEAARSGSTDAYEALARYMDEQISETVLGETLSTNMRGGGSLAAAKTHNEVRIELSKADSDLLSGTLNGTVLRWITELNVPGARPPKLWRSFDEPEDLVARANRDKTVFDMGYRPTPDYITQVYGDGWVPAVAPRPQLLKDPAGKVAAFAAPGQPDLVDALADRAGREASSAMEDIIAPIRKLAMSAPSLEALRDGLIDLYPGADGVAFQRMMQEALAAATLGGRFEVHDGR